MKLIHPGSKTANGAMLRQMLSASTPIGIIEYYVKRVTHADLTDTDTSQALTWSDFPTDVYVGGVMGAHLWLVEVFAGGTVTDVDVILGDTNDDNGLVTTTALETGQTLGEKRTTGAAEFAIRYESAFVPLFTVTSTAGNLDTLTTGEVDIVIPFIRNLSHRLAS